MPTLTAVTSERRTVSLRAPRLKDANAWRELRMSDQQRIEPFWAYSEQTWEDRHRRRAWYRSCISAHRQMRRGTALHAVIEVDGAFAGQCDVWMDPSQATAEIGYWIHSSWAGTRIIHTAVKLALNYLFDELKFERVTAPIDPSNIASIKLVKRMGFHFEGVMRRYMLTGLGRSDHELWAITRDQWTCSSLGASPS